jgi:hypothetical protein
MPLHACVLWSRHARTGAHACAAARACARCVCCTHRKQLDAAALRVFRRIFTEADSEQRCGELGCFLAATWGWRRAPWAATTAQRCVRTYSRAPPPPQHHTTAASKRGAPTCAGPGRSNLQRRAGQAFDKLWKVLEHFEPGECLGSPLGKEVAGVLSKVLLPRPDYCQRSSVPTFQGGWAGPLGWWACAAP